MFIQGLPQTLHRAAVQLALHNHRVDDAAHVVDRRIGHHGHMASGGVNFHFGHMATVGPGGACHRVGGIHKDLAVALARCQRKQVHRQVGAVDFERGVAVGDVFSGHFQLFGGELLGGINGALSPHPHGRAASEDRA